MDIGESVRLRRTQLRMTQKDLSLKTGIKQPTISAIENGVNKPAIETIVPVYFCVITCFSTFQPFWISFSSLKGTVFQKPLALTLPEGICTFCQENLVSQLNHALLILQVPLNVTSSPWPSYLLPTWQIPLPC